MSLWGEQKDSGCQNLAASIKQARKLAKLTQQQAADKAGVNRASLARWENASRAVSIEDLHKLESALGVTFEGIDKKQRRYGDNFHGYMHRVEQSEGYGFTPALPL